MGEKRNRSKESDTRLSPVVTERHKPFCLGRDCDYQEELRRLQIELVKLQEWVRHRGLRVVVLFEGREGRRHQENYREPQPADLQNLPTLIPSFWGSLSPPVMTCP